ncbi:MAG: NADPH-dependent F420 reductase [Burkholderiales bacterium]|nr:NADPH-dependent F420 reductase [Burkholderiales bacterium]
MKDYDETKLRRRSVLQAAAAAAFVAALGTLSLGASRAIGAEGPLKIGIVGSGRIGGTLGDLWLKAGHEVMFASRNLDNDKATAARLGGKARAGTPVEAVQFGDVVLIAVPYSALPQLGRDLAPVLKGKVVIDACNPIVSRDGDIATWAREKGAGLASAELLPGARIVRAFNAVGYARLPEASKRSGERMGMPMASDDAGAIQRASRLVRDVGYEPVVIGALAMGRHLIPGTPLAGEQPPERLRQAAAALK